MSAPQRGAVPQVKGGLLREFLRWYETHWHRARSLTEVYAALPEAARARFDPSRPQLGVLPSAWYPTEAATALGEALCAGLAPAQREELLSRGAEATVAASARGLYRALFSFIATPELYCRHVQKGWDQLHDTGRRASRMLDARALESVITEWPGHSVFLCEVASASMGAILGEMGCREVRIERVECVARGHLRCVSRARWRP